MCLKTHIYLYTLVGLVKKTLINVRNTFDISGIIYTLNVLANRIIILYK